MVDTIIILRIDELRLIQCVYVFVVCSAIASKAEPVGKIFNSSLKLIGRKEYSNMPCTSSDVTRQIFLLEMRQWYWPEISRKDVIMSFHTIH